MDLELGLVRELGHSEELADVVALVALQLDNLSILGVLDDTAVASKLLQAYARAIRSNPAGDSRRRKGGGGGGSGRGERENARERAMRSSGGERSRSRRKSGEVTVWGALAQIRKQWPARAGHQRRSFRRVTWTSTLKQEVSEACSSTVYQRRHNGTGKPRPVLALSTHFGGFAASREGGGAVCRTFLKALVIFLKS